MVESAQAPGDVARRGVPEHRHVPAGRVLTALAVTVVAAATELIGSRAGHSLFLVADAVHLLAHVGIFVVLLMPLGWWHDRSEDVSAIAVLVLVDLIAAGIMFASAHALVARAGEIAHPAIMLLSLVGLTANGVAAWLLRAPAQQWWSFRAAMAHELSDGALTLAGLAGAGAIAVFGWTWVDPGVSLGIGLWLAWWASRLLVRRARHGRRFWAEESIG